MSIRERTIIALHRAYKYVVSPALHAVGGVGGACRFQPTCSEYAAIAVSEYGIVRGGWMSFCRLLRCQPLCRGGFDPVQPNLVRPNSGAPHHDSPALGPRPLR